MIISIAKIAKEMNFKSPDLITRPVGKSIYKKIQEKIKDILDNEVVVLDFNEVRVIDSSCIDELIVKLIIDSWSLSKIFFLKLKNISEIAEINIDSVFKSFSQYKNRNLAIITEDICRNNSFFVGALNDSEKDVIEYLRINKSASLNDLIYFTGLKEEIITGIIDNLYQMRLIRKNKNSIQAI